MATRLLQTYNIDQILRIAGTTDIKQPSSYNPSYNIGIDEFLPVIKYKKDGNNQREVNMLQWGYNTKFQQHIIHARAEELHEKKTFKPLINTKRCVVLVEGYYEWNSRKEPFVFKPRVKRSSVLEPEFPCIFLAGLYSPSDSLILLTKSAVGDLRQVHERMPVILEKNQIDTWINTDKYRYEDIVKSVIFDEKKEIWKNVFFYKLAPFVNDVKNKTDRVLTRYEEYRNGLTTDIGVRDFFLTPQKTKINSAQEKLVQSEKRGQSKDDDEPHNGNNGQKRNDEREKKIELAFEPKNIQREITFRDLFGAKKANEEKKETVKAEMKYKEKVIETEKTKEKTPLKGKLILTDKKIVIDSSFEIESDRKMDPFQKMEDLATEKKTEMKRFSKSNVGIKFEPKMKKEDTKLEPKDEIQEKKVSIDFNNQTLFEKKDGKPISKKVIITKPKTTEQIMVQVKNISTLKKDAADDATTVESDIESGQGELTFNQKQLEEKGKDCTKLVAVYDNLKHFMGGSGLGLGQDYEVQEIVVKLRKKEPEIFFENNKPKNFHEQLTWEANPNKRKEYEGKIGPGNITPELKKQKKSGNPFLFKS